MQFCTKCGAQIADGMQFCTRCGSAIQPGGQPFGANGQSQPGGQPHNTAQQGQPAGQPYNTAQQGQQGGQSFNTTQQGQPYGTLPSGQYPVPAPQTYQVLKRPILTNGQAAIVGYLGWIGFLIAMLAGDRKDPYARLHHSQALLMNIAYIVGGILYLIGYTTLISSTLFGALGAIGGLDYYSGAAAGSVVALVIGVAIWIFTFVCWLIGLIRACRGQGKPVFFFGQVRLLK